MAFFLRKKSIFSTFSSFFALKMPKNSSKSKNQKSATLISQKYFLQHLYQFSAFFGPPGGQKLDFRDFSEIAFEVWKSYRNPIETRLETDLLLLSSRGCSLLIKFWVGLISSLFISKNRFEGWSRCYLPVMDPSITFTRSWLVRGGTNFKNY